MGRNTRNRKDTRSKKTFKTNLFAGNNSNRNFTKSTLIMHDTKCSKCGADCTVPFKPAEGKPVYCKECFMKSKGM